MKTLQAYLNLFFLLLPAYTVWGQTQGVSIKSSASPPHASAMLDVESNNKGILIPRVSLVALTNSVSPVLSPTTGLLVFNTTTTSPFTQGFYYWDKTTWRKLGSELWKETSAGNGDIEYYGRNVRIGAAPGTGSVLYELDVNGDTASFGCRFRTNDNELRWGAIDYNGEIGGGPINSLVQKTSTVVPSSCINPTLSASVGYHPMRFVQLYETGDWGWGITSWGKCQGDNGHTTVDATLNNLHLSSGGKVSISSEGTLFEFKAGGFIPVSDSTLKKTIEDETTVMSKVMQCRPVTYVYKSDASNTTQHGLLAQELLSVFPELVEDLQLYDRDNNGMTLPTYQTKKGVNYMGLITILLKAIQEQQEQIDAMSNRMEIMER